jgi:hypothetical protein
MFPGSPLRRILLADRRRRLRSFRLVVVLVGCRGGSRLLEGSVGVALPCVFSSSGVLVVRGDWVRAARACCAALRPACQIAASSFLFS